MRASRHERGMCGSGGGGAWHRQRGLDGAYAQFLLRALLHSHSAGELVDMQALVMRGEACGPLPLFQGCYQLPSAIAPRPGPLAVFGASIATSGHRKQLWPAAKKKTSSREIAEPQRQPRKKYGEGSETKASRDTVEMLRAVSRNTKTAAEEQQRQKVTAEK